MRLQDWLAGAPNPWPAIRTLADGDHYLACFYLAALDLAHTRQEKPYLKLQLADRNGSVEARVWDDAERINGLVRAGTFVGVRGRVQVYRGEHQLKVDEIATVAVAPQELSLFLPTSERDATEMDRELTALIESIRDTPLKTLLRRLLGPDAETGRRYRRSPAAKRNHHAYVGGLLEHSLSVTGVCDVLAQHYGDKVDRDLLVAGALVHDIGKIRELSTEISFPYTQEGKLLGHILLGLRIVEDEARHVPELAPERLQLLLHLIASHQGRYEWQSPREPRTIEAVLLHYADNLDAKAAQALALLDSVPGGWTAYNRSFAGDLLRHGGQAADVGDARPADATPAPEAAHGSNDRGREKDATTPQAPSPERSQPEPPERDPRLSLFGDG